jgi:transposase
VELDWDVRQKSRFAATDSQGRELAIFLPRGQAVRGGDVLVAEMGPWSACWRHRRKCCTSPPARCTDRLSI